MVRKKHHKRRARGERGSLFVNRLFSWLFGWLFNLLWGGLRRLNGWKFVKGFQLIFQYFYVCSTLPFSKGVELTEEYGPSIDYVQGKLHS